MKARVTLLGDGGVEPSLLSEILEAACLPPGHVGLLVGDASLSGEFQAVTVARALIPRNAGVYGLVEHRKIDWECGIIVGPTWAARQQAFPAYFAYLLGHEAGHATTVLTDLQMVIFENLVLDGIKQASQGSVTRYDQLPYEVRYDQFGIAVAESVYPRTQLDDELRTIVKDGLTDDESRLGKVLELPARHDLDGLREELAKFCLPYRQKLVHQWETRRAAGGLKVAAGVTDLNSLWTGWDL